MSSGCDSAYVCTGSIDKSFMWLRSNSRKRHDGASLSTHMSVSEGYVMFGAGAYTHYPANTYETMYIAIEQRPAL